MKKYEKLHLFVDTNIFLNIYHYSNDDLNELRKIVALMESRQLILYITEQLINEFHRNRENKIKETIKVLETMEITTKFPNICKSYKEEYDEMRKNIGDFSTNKKLLISKLMYDIQEKKLKADKIINLIFKRSNKLKITDEIIKKSKQRFDLGNPPGKEKSYGDAINWELLLDGIKDNDIEYLYFITSDSDYISKINNSRFNDFLFCEWEEKKGYPIKFYNNLSLFFREKFPDIKLAEELRKSLLINTFINSTSFRQTRLTLARLSWINYYTKEELNKIITASIENNQINWIYSDVREDLNLLIKGRRDEIDEHLLSKFDEIYNKTTQKKDEENEELDF